MKKGESTVLCKQLDSMLFNRKHLTLFYLFEFEQNVRNTAGCCISRISNQETKRREIFHFIKPKNNKDEKDLKTGSGHRCCPG